VIDEPETAASQDLSPADEKPAPKPRKETRPRFDSDKEIEAEVSFRRDLPAKEPEPAAPVVPLEADLPPPEEAQTALVKVERKALAGVVPFEIDYSGYTAPQYPRVDPNVNLRSVQAEAVDEFFETKLRRPVIVLPTGCGKTVAGLAIAGRINGRVLWIAHRDELITQPAKEIENLFPDLEYGVEKAEIANGTGKRVVIASIQTLQKTDRLKRIMAGAPFSVVIYDECHHATSVSSLKILTRLGCLREDGKGPMLLGLTATIERADNVSLGTIFEDVIYSCSIQKAIELGYLVAPKPKKVHLPLNRAALRTINGDYVLSALDKEMARVNAAQATATAILANCGTRKTIAFCTSINQAQRTAEACVKLGLKAAWVSGLGQKGEDGKRNGMSKGERKAVLAKFTSGEIQVLTCADLLTEGYDEKSIGAVAIARPTKSQGRYIQMAGRLEDL